MATVRKTPPLNLTISEDVRADLDALAAEDAAEWGRSYPNLSATVAALVVAEKKRRAKRQKKDEDG